jgi:hypothetical protein
LAQRIGSLKHALSGQHKTGGLAMELLMTHQEAGQVSSTKDALVADVLLEGTASATGRVPVKQQAQSEEIERTRLMEAPTDNAPRKAAGIPGYGSSETFSGHR